MAAEDPPAAPRSVPALLADRRFGPWFAGSLAWAVAAWMQDVVVALVLFDATGSALVVGVAAAARFGVSLVLGPVAGVLTDRFERRRYLLATQAIGVAGTGLLTALPDQAVEDVTPVLVAVALVGLGQALSQPAMHAVVPALVPPADVAQAVGLHQVTFNLGRALGPAAGAAALASLGRRPSFALGLVGFAAFFVAVAVLRPTAPARAGGPPATVRRALAEALAYVRSAPPVARRLVAVAAIGTAIDPVTTLAPALAEELGGGEALAGVLVSAFGGGAVACGFLQRRLRDVLGPTTAGAVALWALAAGLAATAAAPGPGIAAAGTAVAGAGFVLALTDVTTHVQTVVPDALRGRVMALWGVCFMGLRPVSALLAGGLADALGARVGALPAVAVAAAAGALVWGLRSGAAAAPRVLGEAGRDPAPET